MASISAACFLASTPTPKPHSVSFALKPPFKPSQLHYFSTKIGATSSLSLTQPAKFRRPRTSVWASSTAESHKLPSDVRKRAMDAVDSCGRRVTIGDVVSNSSLSLNEAQKALQALAVDTEGFLEVSDEGDVVYVLPKDYRLKLVVKSFNMMNFESLWKMGKMAAAFLVKVSFWVSLAASSVTPITLMLLMAVVMCFFPFRVNFWIQSICESLCNLFDGRFIADVFSITFGDGDPNKGIEEKRWKMIGQCIDLNGGVVTAEELAPYLDPETIEKMDHDSYMLPVLLRLDGHPEVDEEGNILYHFPSVQYTAAPQSRAMEHSEFEKFLKEEYWRFCRLDGEKIKEVGDKLGCNILWALTLYLFVAECYDSQWAPMWDVFVSFMYYRFRPLLEMYAIFVASFTAISEIRRFFIKMKNAKIERHNQIREQCAEALGYPDLSLKRKLSSARNMARRINIDKDRVVYSSDRDLYEDYERHEWDQRFKESCAT